MLVCLVVGYLVAFFPGEGWEDLQQELPFVVFVEQQAVCTEGAEVEAVDCGGGGCC